MKNIYIVDEAISSKKNGIGTYFRELLYCLSKFDHNICQIIFNAEVNDFKIIKNKGLKKILFPIFRYDYFTNQYKIIDKFLRLYIEDNSDNIFLFNHAPCEKLLESIKLSHPKSRLIFVIHDMGWTFPLKGDLDFFLSMINSANNSKNNFIDYFRQEQKMYSLVDRVVCLSTETYNVLDQIYGVDINKITLIPNGLRNVKIDESTNTIELRKKLMIQLDEKILLFVGRPTYQKGLSILLKALDIVLSKHSNVRLVIVGSDNDTKIENFIFESSLKSTRITFTGLITKEELEKWYMVADIGLIPSFYEQCSYTGIEMMMYGLPIICSDGFNLKSMFTNGKNARIVSIGNRQDNYREYILNLAKAIVELLDAKDLCESLRRNARRIYNKKYNINQMKVGYKQLIELL